MTLCCVLATECDSLEAIQLAEGLLEAGPPRWVVERTFGWMTRHRRLVRDYGARVDVSEAMIDIAVGGFMIQRLAHQ